MTLDLGLGLAMWKGTKAYEDVKYISSTSNKEFYTALNNDDQETCVDWDCTGKLVMKSTEKKYVLSHYTEIIPHRFGNRQKLVQRKDFTLLTHMEGLFNNSSLK